MAAVRSEDGLVSGGRAALALDVCAHRGLRARRLQLGATLRAAIGLRLNPLFRGGKGRALTARRPRASSLLLFDLGSGNPTPKPISAGLRRLRDAAGPCLSGSVFRRPRWAPQTLRAMLRHAQLRRKPAARTCSPGASAWPSSRKMAQAAAGDRRPSAAAQVSHWAPSAHRRRLEGCSGTVPAAPPAGVVRPTPSRDIAAAGGRVRVSDLGPQVSVCQLQLGPRPTFHATVSGPTPLFLRFPQDPLPFLGF